MNFENIPTCPICNGSSISFFANGASNKELFAMLNIPNAKSSWSHCGDCNHVFLNPKFSRSIEDRLYGKESIYRKHSLGGQTLQAYLETIDNTAFNKGAVHHGHKRNIDKILEVIELKSNSTIMDFGAGFGAASSAFIFKGFQYFGFEIDSFCLGIARDLQRNIQSTVDNGRQFDLVYSSQVFEHISSPGNAIADMAKFAKNDGFVFINVPTHQFTLFPPRNLAKGGVWCMNWGHFHSYTLESLSCLIGGAGCLEVVASWYTNNDVNVLAKKSSAKVPSYIPGQSYSVVSERRRFYFSKYISSNLWLMFHTAKSLIKKVIS